MLNTRSSSQASSVRRLRRFASGHDAAFGVGRLRRSAASHRKAAEAARGGNYRIDAVCPFIGIRCAWLLHREGQAQPQAKTHEEGSGPTLQRSSEYIAIMSFVGRSCLTTAQRFAQAKGLRANPSFEPTRSGRPLQAFISFSALRALPPRAAQLKR